MDEFSRRDVQVAHHLGATPSPEELDGVGIHSSKEERHGAAGV